MATALLQLDPPLPLVKTDGHQVLALVLLDYGPEWPSYLLCADEVTRELWWLDQKELRLRDNVTLGRLPT